MPTVAEVDDLILGAFAAEWGVTTPIAWPNDYFDPEAVADKGAGWVRIALNEVDGDFAGLGTDNTIRRGQVFVQIFVAEGSGSAALSALTEKAERWLATWPVNAVTMRTPSIQHVGPDGAGWTQKNVVAEYVYRTS